MIISIIGAVINAIVAVVVTIITGVLSRDTKRRQIVDEKAEERAKLHAEMMLLLANLVNANTMVSTANACAIRDGKVNGQMDEALAAVNSAEDAYHVFMKSVAARQIAGAKH